MLGAAVVACGSAEEEPQAALTYPQVLDELVEDAERAGAEESQVAILRSGEVGFAEYQAAMDRYVDCVRAAGVEVAGPRVHTKEGFPQYDLGFRVGSGGLTDSQLNALVTQCQERYSKFVEIAYVSSPEAKQAREDLLESLREPILACLRSNGVTIADDASTQELTQAMDELESANVGDESKDCYLQTGYLYEDLIGTGAVPQPGS